ncbi:MAG: ABC transporter substrate-binding protein [Pseudomonadota bacterium]
MFDSAIRIDMRHASPVRSAKLLVLAVALVLASWASALADGPKRIVIAGGDLTEIAFSLGFGDRIIGVDSTSNFPAETQEREQIGYVRRLTAEGILSLAPDLVVLAHDAGPDTAIDQLQASGIKTVRGPATDSAEGVSEKIRFVGEALGAPEAAAELAQSVEDQLADVARRVAELPDKPKVLFVLSLDRGTPLVGGIDTSADRMIALAGAQNAAAEIAGFKPMSQEAIIAAQPDVILMMSQYAERLGGLDTVTARPEFALTPAGEEGRAVAIEGMLLLGFGPRTPEGIAMLARALHPETAPAAGL